MGLLSLEAVVGMSYKLYIYCRFVVEKNIFGN